MFKTWNQGPEMQAVQSPQSGALGAGPGGWHPTVLYMLALVLLEIVLVAWLSRNLLS
jgi:hypothetical protein